MIFKGISALALRASALQFAHLLRPFVASAKGGCVAACGASRIRGV
jgi:hypothetical protein